MSRPQPPIDLDRRPEAWSAVTAAFASIAASDGEVAKSERERFERWLADHSRRADVHRRALALFDELATKLVGPDAERAHKEVAAFLRACETNDDRALALAAAQAAIVADERIDEREELALQRICELLGVPLP